MRKLYFTVIMIVGLLLTACGQATPTSLATVAVATEDTSAPKMDCQVVSMRPTQGPTEVSMFPPPGEDDWVLGGNPNAAVTIIEYSDFQ